MEQGLLNLYKYQNNNNPIIIEYRNKRKILSEVMNDIYLKELENNYEFHYYSLVSFIEKTITKYYKTLNIKNYALDTNSGQQFIILTLIYNYAGNGIPACHYYLNKCRYKKIEKIQMLNNICNSKIGLFEIVSFDKQTKRIIAHNIITNEIIEIIDEGLSYACEYQNVKDYILLSRVLKIDDYYVNDGTIQLKNADKLINLYKNNKINDVELLILGKAFDM